ncbi:amino acid adenylation domain-containing protein [Candidatus Neptunochlamydia vexilliferae]|uniref:Uncharacterized protein n=1 Tax=Candidatus Neptunichlamydia vexilliferae TaxID=1651774 RepID=A0ABS0AXY9_9BACT|nr:amino acid adenylation domain-containing protein [Candidatus Neptunochlamydia vexilliferae]MBF5058996.1 hypothetical protein [Candidatus Neptunochlamydia vexilliferae]
MRYLLHDLFIETVMRTPEAIALVEESGKSYSYKALNLLSNQCGHLIEKEKKEMWNKPYVGILATPHPLSIAAILGALKVGCAYVPLDEKSPSSRLQMIIENTGLDLVFADSPFFEKHRKLFQDNPSLKVILLDGEEILNNSSKEVEGKNQVSDDLAYILHSSGSTGVPKGIMLTHRNGRTFIDWMKKEFKLTKDDVMISRAPFKFDLSTFDLFDTFAAGAKLVLFDWHKKRNREEKHQDYVGLMEREKVSLLYTTPSTLITLMNHGGLNQRRSALRQIMYAGEPFPTPLLRRFQNLLPQVKISNIYGPTETNIITYYHIDQIPEDDTPIPLGHVVDDTEIIVVREDRSGICAPNELGELWCRGGTVTLGYLGLKDKTEENLITSPFHPYPSTFWRTGDFGFRDTEGLLHYRGRRDHMVKVKGYRIELGEIEAALAKIDELDLFCVVPIKDEKYGNKLYCLYSLAPSKTIGKKEIADFLGKHLPEYMIPWKFIEKKTLPKTSSEKVDRIRLMEELKESSLIGP